MTPHRQTADRRWTRIVPDLLALIYSLILAWFLHWSVKDLVWGLWLSSLLVGFTTIVLVVLGPVAKEVRRETGIGPQIASVAGGLFALAFFTVHFGMFHFVHSVFLNLFFPVDNQPQPGFPRPALIFGIHEEMVPDEESPPDAYAVSG